MGIELSADHQYLAVNNVLFIMKYYKLVDIYIYIYMCVCVYSGHMTVREVADSKECICDWLGAVTW